MNREQIMQLEGRELDRMVAEKVMGWHVYHYDKDVEENCYFMLVDEEFEPVAEFESYSFRTGERKTDEEAWNDCPKFSTSISAAWEVLELPKIMDRYQIGVYPTSFGKWIARKYMPGGRDCTVQADTAPLAICRCVLLAVMEVET